MITSSQGPHNIWAQIGKRWAGGPIDGATSIKRPLLHTRTGNSYLRNIYVDGVDRN